MSNDPKVPETTKTQANSSTPTTLTAQKGGKPKKTKETEEKVPVTLSVSADFARKLKIVVSAIDESLGAYVESRMEATLRRDLKKILEEMA